ncbi:hypothetical protein [uncultured Maricaulis sp.]|uniref:hypothetical protein n=1 Tax=uncultured Maricaulis sp. TaxID=174710 RepID=UPI00262BFE93|nr:hypothetical protein [uncultured Maricaulis sp.]
MPHHLTTLLAGVSALILLPAAATAQQSRIEFSSDNAVERSDPFIDQDVLEPQGAFDLETGFDSNNWLRIVKPVGEGRVWRFEQQARLRRYEDRDDLNSILFTPRVQYWAPVGEHWQMRAIAEASVLNRDSDRHYTRFQAEGQMRYRPAANRETVLRLRANQYDFGDQVVAGLDQRQWRVGIEQYGYGENRRSGWYLAGFFTSSSADADRFSFSETALRARTWQPLGENTRGELRLEASQRSYDGPFSAVQMFDREDTRWRATGRVEHGLTDQVTLYGEAGYVDNESNIDLRSYSGAVFQIGIRIRNR